MQAGDLFVQDLGQHIDLAHLVGVGTGEQLDLRQGLVGEGVGHHKAGVTGGAAQVHQTALGQQGDLLAVGELDLVHLGLHFFPLVLLDRSHIDFIVEVTDVADDGLILHGNHVLVTDDVLVAGGGHEDIGLVGSIFHGHYTIAFHGGLQGVDGVDLGHPDLGRQRAQRLGGALAHVAVAGHASHLAGDHHVGGALDAVHQRFAAAVQIVELGLGHRVVDVDGAEQQRALGRHFVEAVHTGGGLFGHAHDLGRLAAVPGRVLGQLGLDGGEDDALFFRAGVGQHGQILLGALAQVHEHGGVAAVIQDHVGAFAFGAGGAEFKDGVGVVPVVFQRLALDGVDRHAGFGDGSRCVVLGREDVARGPAHLRAQRRQRLDQHGGLDGHVQRAGDARALQGLGSSELLTHGHQTGHLGFGDPDFLAAPGSQGNIGNGRISGVEAHGSVHGFLQILNEKPRSAAEGE